LKLGLSFHFWWVEVLQLNGLNDTDIFLLSLLNQYW
jgi:hypothetical protein